MNLLSLIFPSSFCLHYSTDLLQTFVSDSEITLWSSFQTFQQDSTWLTVPFQKCLILWASHTPSFSSHSDWWMLACLRSSSLTLFCLHPFSGWVHLIPWPQITCCTLMTSELIPLFMTSTNTKLNSWSCPSLLTYISSPLITIFEFPVHFLALIKSPWSLFLYS